MTIIVIYIIYSTIKYQLSFDGSLEYFSKIEMFSVKFPIRDLHLTLETPGLSDERNYSFLIFAWPSNSHCTFSLVGVDLNYPNQAESNETIKVGMF